MLTKALFSFCILPLMLSTVTAAELPLRVGDGETEGIPWQGPEAVRERVDQIMERQHGQAPAKKPMRIHPHETEDTVEPTRVNPASQDTPIWPPLSIGGGGNVVPSAPQSTSVSFTGATLADTRAYPPDSMGAVGPAQ